MLSWTDYASWDASRWTCEWRTETHSFTEAVERLAGRIGYTLHYEDGGAAPERTAPTADPEPLVVVRHPVEQAGQWLWGDFNYWSLSAEGRHYLPIGQRFVAANRLRVGADWVVNLASQPIAAQLGTVRSVASEAAHSTVA